MFLLCSKEQRETMYKYWCPTIKVNAIYETILLIVEITQCSLKDILQYSWRK